MKNETLEEIMGIFGKFICMGFFAFALLAGFAAVSEAAEPDAYAIQQQLDAKFAQLDNELASPNPDRKMIEALSREIGELRGKELSARAGQGSRPYYNNGYGYGPCGYGPCGYYRGNGWHHGGHYRGGHGCW